MYIGNKQYDKDQTGSLNRWELV